MWCGAIDRESESDKIRGRMVGWMIAAGDGGGGRSDGESVLLTEHVQKIN